MEEGQSSNINWHQLKVSEVFARLRSSKKGLTEKEARRRLAEFGENKLSQEKPISKLRLFFGQFNNVLVYIILGAILLSAFLHHYADAIFIFAVVALNVIVSFFQEYKAEKTVLELKKLISYKTSVFRDEKIRIIDSARLTIGDIIILKAGDIVSADARVIHSDNLKTNEASLTGEFSLVLKDKEPSGDLAGQDNMVFAGTVVLEGSGRAIITAIGKNTKLGKIVDLVNETKKEKTPLQKKIAELSVVLGAAIMGMILFVFALGAIMRYPIYEIFLSAVSLAVSVIPEGLLPAITIILVIAMRRMLKKKALVKRLSATETLGGVTVICVDKTGTLTEGRMRVSQVISGDKKEVMRIAAMVGEATVENHSGGHSKWVVQGRPTDKALLHEALKMGISLDKLAGEYKEISTLFFDSKTKYSAKVLFDREKGEYILNVLGAPEILLSKSKFICINGECLPADGENIKNINAEVDALAKKGLRVIVCGRKNLGNSLPEYKEVKEIFNDINLLGIIALEDPLRQDAAYAVRMAIKAGIKPIIITGDHKLTARAIAEEIGFLENSSDDVMEGAMIDKISPEELKIAVNRIKVFYRVSPEDKLKIVQALQENGEVVAMTGDGVNDAPALKKANIGMALGSGTDAAKEAADVVLLDDNFKVIIEAIEEGRTIFENIRKVLIYLVADDFSELLLFFAALLLKFPLPLLPMQILWINIVEDGFPDIALTTEKKEKELMLRKPRDPHEPILSSKLKKWSAVVIVASFFAAFGIFLGFWKMTGDISRTRTVVFALMSLDSLAFAFTVRSFKKKVFRKDIFDNYYLDGAVLIGIILLLSAIYVPLLQRFINTIPLGLKDWGIIALVIAAEMAVINKMKMWML